MSQSSLPPCFQGSEKSEKLQNLTGDFPRLWLDLFEGFREIENDSLWNPLGASPLPEALEAHERCGKTLLQFGCVAVAAAQAAGDADQAAAITTWLTFVRDSLALWHPKKQIDPQVRTQLEGMFSGDRSEA